MIRTLVLLGLVAGALVLTSGAPNDRQQWLERGASMVGTAAQQIRTAGPALMERARSAGSGADPFAGLRDQGVVTETFGARRDSATPSEPPAVRAPAPERATTGWRRTEYESAKRSLFDALHRLEGSAHED